MIIPFNQKEHLNSIVDLHYKELPWSTISRLGKGHLFTVYERITNLPSTFGFVWIIDDQVIGFTLCSLNSKELRKTIQTSFSIKDLKNILKLSIEEPGFIISALETKFIIPFSLQKIDTNAEWIAWVVDRSHPSSRRAAIECFFRTNIFFREKGQLFYIAQGDKRSKESNPFLNMIKNVEKKSFFRNNLYVIKL